MEIGGIELTRVQRAALVCAVAEAIGYIGTAGTIQSTIVAERLESALQPLFGDSNDSRRIKSTQNITVVQDHSTQRS